MEKRWCGLSDLRGAKIAPESCSDGAGCKRTENTGECGSWPVDRNEDEGSLLPAVLGSLSEPQWDRVERE